jgi:hypothetical protein
VDGEARSGGCSVEGGLYVRVEARQTEAGYAGVRRLATIKK